MSTNKIKLNEQQKKAVEYLSGPLLVLAGPGTGKTQLLSQKIAFILENTDSNPEDILAITFTEAGAENMRQRLMSVIGMAALRVNIGTYHAFGASILKKYKDYEPSFNRKLEGNINEVLKYKIMREILDELPAMDILKHAKIGDLIETISSAKSARLKETDLEKIATINTLDSAEISKRITPILEKRGKKVKFDIALQETYLPLVEILSEFSGEILPRVKREAQVMAEELKLILEKEKQKEKPLVGEINRWIKDRFERDRSGGWRINNVVANKKLASLAVVMKKYGEKMAENGWYDFDDMIEMAIEILKNDVGFRMTLSEKYQFILLDEFQDTNPSQFEIIKLLTDYEQPMIMAVGDDDQAIYEFQGAKSGNLLEFQEHYGAEEITLKENYRSTEEVLSLSRKIAEQLGDSFAKNKKVDKNLLAKNNDALKREEKTAKIERHEFLTSAEEYDWVAQEIRKLIDAGEDLKEIAVMTHKHKGIKPILPYLKEAKIPIAYEKRDNISEDEKIQSLYKMAKLVLNVSAGKIEENELAEVVMMPFWGFRPRDFMILNWEARKEKKNLWLKIMEEERFGDFVKIIENIATLNQEQPFERILNLLIGIDEACEGIRSPFLEYYKKENGEWGQFELMNKLLTLRENLYEYTRKEHCDLADFVKFTEDYLEAGIAVLITSPYQDAKEAVQVMTAHKSKGLEFKHVFIINVDDYSWGNAKGNNNTLVLPRNLSHIRHTGKTEDEQLRLLFVAITRAKQHLVMTNSICDFTGKERARLAYLQEVEQSDKKVRSPFLETALVRHEGKMIAERKILEKYWGSVFFEPLPEMRQMLMSKMKNYRLTASDMKTFIDLAYAGPLKFYEQKILKIPQSKEGINLILGNLVHGVLERVVKEKIRDEEAMELFHELLNSSELSEKEKEEVKEIGETSIELVLAEFGEKIRNDNARAETKLSYELGINNERVLVEGKVDLMIVDKDEKKIAIYDYKTSTSGNGNWNTNIGLYKNALQLEMYKVLVEDSVEYYGYEVDKAGIIFTKPNIDGVAELKEYDFRMLGKEKTKRLMLGVYRAIKNLEFLDWPEIQETSDKEKTLKEIKEFVEKMCEKGA